MNPAYLSTRFLAEPPPGGWPARFAVVTACNPAGRPARAEANDAANAALEAALRAAGRQPFPVAGGSPDFRHREDGFGVGVATLAEAIELGRAWRQEAVFWITDDSLFLADCGGLDLIPMGRWTERLSPAAGNHGAVSSAHKR